MPPAGRLRAMNRSARLPVLMGAIGVGSAVVGVAVATLLREWQRSRPATVARVQAARRLRLGDAAHAEGTAASDELFDQLHRAHDVDEGRNLLLRSRWWRLRQRENATAGRFNAGQGPRANGQLD